MHPQPFSDTPQASAAFRLCRTAVISKRLFVCLLTLNGLIPFLCPRLTGLSYLMCAAADVMGQNFVTLSMIYCKCLCVAPAKSF